MDYLKEAMDMAFSIPGVIVLYGATSFACKWLCGKHIHRLFFSGMDADKAFVDFVIDESAGVLAKSTKQVKSAIVPKLRALFNGETDSPELSRLLRIDYELEKRSPTVCHLWIHLLLKSEDGASGKKLTTGHDIKWAWLPELVREKFIRENPARQAYIFVSRQEEEANAGAHVEPGE